MIHRREVVQRHNPELFSDAPLSGDARALWASPLSVGNGTLAFTADFTGLQSFPERAAGIPLTTMAQWGWHHDPVPDKETELRPQWFEHAGRPVAYLSDATGQEERFDRLRQNPHRLHLGQIGLRWAPAVLPEDFGPSRQKLSLYEGMLTSRFTVRGASVETMTLVDSATDTLLIRIRIPDGADPASVPALCVAFPYGSPGRDGADWRRPDDHRTVFEADGAHRLRIHRCLDDDRYELCAAFHGLRPRQSDAHTMCWDLTGVEAWVAFRFSSGSGLFPDRPEALESRTRDWWQSFWETGGAMDFSGSSDPRAAELERRIVLSRYLTAIQCAGPWPPAETGLVSNSWYGKFHLEMHPWHAAHFPLWGHPELLERSMQWYLDILPRAREIAAAQGYRGARWPKMTDPSGRNAPSSIAVLLAWQQPHPILLAELLYRSRPTRETLERYAPLVFESAEFLASYLVPDPRTGKFSALPPLIPAQETHRPEDTRNPTFELAYFRWALRTADLWRDRLSLPAEADFRHIAEQMAPLPVRDGVYLAHEACPGTFTPGPFTRDHPSMLAALGFVPGDEADPVIMERTLRRVLDKWDLTTLWGWDFPMIAMTCVRLGLPETAVDLLLMDAPNNTYLRNGHNPQPSHADLPAYLPGNGGLLLAVATMAAGCNRTFGQCDWQPGACRLPGFPASPAWQIQAEGIVPYL